MTDKEKIRSLERRLKVLEERPPQIIIAPVVVAPIPQPVPQPSYPLPWYPFNPWGPWTTNICESTAESTALSVN